VNTTQQDQHIVDLTMALSDALYAVEFARVEFLRLQSAHKTPEEIRAISHRAFLVCENGARRGLKFKGSAV
jgi:hypothetical protein